MSAQARAVVRALLLAVGVVLIVAGVVVLRRGKAWGAVLLGVGLLVAAAGISNL